MEIIKKLSIRAQDPRAMAVKNDRLYVIPFESNNQTQISGCVGEIPAVSLCTFDATEHVVNNNNVLSQNIVVDVVKHPDIPDRDLFIYDTATDQLIETVSHLGTLLYGIAVNSKGDIYITQTDARNDKNGASGTFGDGLLQMENRAFLNRITKVACGGESCQSPQHIELEPLPPTNPPLGEAVATPFAIQISQDDSTLVITAAGSNQLILLNAESQQIISRVQVGGVPRGLALAHDSNGRLTTAWVLNAVDNSVSKVVVDNLMSPTVQRTISLPDPTHPVVKMGRLAFNNAKASTSQTFSCESCHPDGGTDQLLWVLNTPICDLPGCDQIPPRSTMPIRGLQDTAPYHWDGIPGDPYGGINTASINAPQPANCQLQDPVSCTRNLVDGGLASTMCMVGNCPINESGQAGALSESERHAMANFLLSIPYPPAQRRSMTNELSDRAKAGFNLFHILGDEQGGPNPNVCGNCHRMPFWVSTNTPGSGMDAPTFRGAYDRWLILPQGRLNIIDFTFYELLARQGVPEERMWQLSWASRPRFNPVWNMITEGSTGFSGAFGRQIPLNPSSINEPQYEAMFVALEAAAHDGGVLLQGNVTTTTESPPKNIEIEFFAQQYWLSNMINPIDRSQLISMVESGQLVGTLTARVGAHVDVTHPQPALWTSGSLQQQTGAQQFPVSSEGSKQIILSGRHVAPTAHILIDGQRVTGTVDCLNGGQMPDCHEETLVITLTHLPDLVGQHFLQVQNPDGLFSNDFIFYTEEAGLGMPTLDISGPWFNNQQGGHGWYLELLDSLDPNQNQRLLAYWYTYQNGQPIWLLGVGKMINGRAQIAMRMASGTSFPPNHNPAEIEFEKWGTLEFEFASAESGKALWFSDQPGFEAGHMSIEKLAVISSDVAGCLSGSYLDPNQSGHGLSIQVVNVNGQNSVLATWFAFLDGQPVWMTGSGHLNETNSQVNLSRFTGTNFPPNFRPSDINQQSWGDIQLIFSGSDQVNVTWASQLAGYGSGVMNMQKLTRLAGHDCITPSL
ncbi:YncE family protein [Marinicella meishanensis]|uniref:YncE family protein n=1 Tax=Marinicella meishanensis TaxID=2873263 RepID=UPI001CBD661A|nr:hypothetical protein [Marinicella sp. NBU2979]